MGHLLPRVAEVALPARAPDFSGTEGRTAPRSEIRDPCIIREGDTLHLVFTLWPFRNRDERFLHEQDPGGSPGIALHASRDPKACRFGTWLVKSSGLPDD